MGRPKGSKTRKASAASRINGRKGGRPLARLPLDMKAQLGPLPLFDTLKQTRWYTTAILMLSDLQLDGIAGINALAEQIRKNMGAVAKMMPHDILFEAKRTVTDDEDELAADVGPEDEEIERDPSAGHGVRSRGG